MNQQKYLYVLFSATPFRMGSWIRAITAEPYNHVAIGTEESLSELYAFARRYYHTPLYGGFVSERPCRYRHNGVTANVRLYRLPLTAAQWDTLQNLLERMKQQPDRYLYNHLSALAAPFHRKVTIRDAYTCAEFTVSVLQQLGFDFNVRKFYTLGGIAKKLAPYHMYDGAFPAHAQEDGSFFDLNAVAHPFLASTRDILRLFWRKSTV